MDKPITVVIIPMLVVVFQITWGIDKHDFRVTLTSNVRKRSTFSLNLVRRIDCFSESRNISFPY